VLRIKALGSLTVLGDDGPITGAAAQPRRLSLLALLARAGERGITRDKALGYLWPDAEEDRGRRTLANALSALRRDLGNDEVFLGGNDLRLNRDIVTCDVAEFEQAISAGELANAASLYEGPFLDGFRVAGAPEFERWADAERFAIAHAYSAVVERIAREAESKQDYGQAVTWWRKLASHDPLNARHALRLMEALTASGDRNGALRQARIYEALVEQELDLPPDRAVAEYAARLRQESGLTSRDAVRAQTGAAVTNEVASPEAPLVATYPPAHATLSAPVSLPSVIPSDEVAVGISSNGSITTSPNSLDAAQSAVVDEAAPKRRAIPRWVLAGGALIGLAALSWVVLGIRAKRSADAAGAPVVALGRITDYRSPGGDDVARPLIDMLATNLARVPGLRVVSTARMYELMTQMGSTSDTAAGVLIAAARRAGASEVLDCALYDVGGGTLRLDLRLVDLASGSVRSAYSVSGTSPFVLVDSGTAKLVAELGAVIPSGSVADVTTRSLAAYRLYEAGLRSYYQGDLRAASRLFAAALDEDSTFAMAAYYDAVLASESQYGDATKFRRAVRLAQRATDRERLRILTDWAMRRYSPNLRALAETLAVRYPDEVEGHLYSGIGLLTEGRFLEAIAPLRRVIAMDSLSFDGSRGRCNACEAMRSLVSVYQHLDSLAAAEREARRWVTLQPRSSNPWMHLAETLGMEGHFEGAADAVRQWTAIDPTLGGAAHTHAYYYAQSERYDEAERLLRAQLVAGADRPTLLWYLTIVLRDEGRLTEALESARGARADRNYPIAPGTAPPSALHQGQVLFESGRYGAARALFDSTAGWAAPSQDEFQRARTKLWAMTHGADALAAAGDTTGLAVRADSIEMLSRLSAHGRDHRLHHHVRALLLRARGDTAGAIREFRAAIYSPNLGYTRTNLELGRLLLATGRPKEAVDVLQPALRGAIEGSNLYVTRTELHELLAQAYAGALMADSAAAHYRVVVRSWERADPMFHPRREVARQWLARYSGDGGRAAGER